MLREWWGGGSILFGLVVGLALNLSCPLFFSYIKKPLNHERLLGLLKALAKASTVNVYLKSPP